MVTCNTYGLKPLSVKASQVKGEGRPLYGAECQLLVRHVTTVSRQPVGLNYSPIQVTTVWFAALNNFRLGIFGRLHGTLSRRPIMPVSLQPPHVYGVVYCVMHLAECRDIVITVISCTVISCSVKHLLSPELWGTCASIVFDLISTDWARLSVSGYNCCYIWGKNTMSAYDIWGKNTHIYI